MHHFFCVGDHVTLVTSYYLYHDAINGPLMPGDVGLMISCDIHNGVIRALVVVSGRTWYYDKRALGRAPENGGPTPSTMPASLPSNLHAFSAAPSHCAAKCAPAAASSSTGGFPFGAGPAAGSPSSHSPAVVAVGAPAATSPSVGGFSFGAGPTAENKDIAVRL